MAEPLSTSHRLPKLPLKLFDLSSIQMADLLDHRNFMHHLLPLDFVIYCQVYLEQMFQWIQDLTSQHFFIVVFHHVILEKRKILLFLTIR